MGVIPMLSRNCDGNESWSCHCPLRAGRPASRLS